MEKTEREVTEENFNRDDSKYVMSIARRNRILNLISRLANDVMFAPGMSIDSKVSIDSLCVYGKKEGCYVTKNPGGVHRMTIHLEWVENPDGGCNGQ